MLDNSIGDYCRGLRETLGIVGAEQAVDLDISDFRISDDDLRAVDTIEAYDGRSDRLVLECDLGKLGRWQMRGRRRRPGLD